MTDISKLRAKRLGSPPPREEASTNLSAPEVAPSAARTAPKVDGRTLRRTNRTVAFATRVSPEYDREIRELCQREGWLLVEAMERALEALKTNLAARNRKADR